MDIDIIKIYKQAFEIVKKNKALWVFGMALAVFTAGGAGLNSGQSVSSLGNLSKGSQQSVNLPGSATGALPQLMQTWDAFFTYLKDLFFSIPPILYISLGLAVIIAIIIGIIIGLIVRSWAIGASIGAINDAYDNRKVSLSSGSEQGIKNIKKIIWLSIVPGLLYCLVILGAGLFIGLLMLILGKTFLVFIPYLLAVVVGLFAVFGFLAIAVIQIWAQRIVVIEGKGAKEAFFEGWELVKKYFGEMILLGCANCLLNCCIGVLIVSVLAGLVGAVAGIYALNKQTGVMFMVLLGLLVLIVLLFSVLIAGIYKIFNYTTWNILYRQIKERQK